MRFFRFGRNETPCERSLRASHHEYDVIIESKKMAEFQINASGLRLVAFKLLIIWRNLRESFFNSKLLQLTSSELLSFDAINS